MKDFIDMKSDYQTAYILMDENDLKDFKNSYGYTVSHKSLLVPFDFLSMMQVVFHESKQLYYIPKMIEESEFSAAKSVYAESQIFLKQLLLANEIVDEDEDSFPLEYFWFCFWATVNRAVSFCSDFINKHSVREVILIKRNKSINHGGLSISTASFTDLVEAFFKSRSIKVKVLKAKGSYPKPRTIFYSQRQGLKASLRHLMKFIYWRIGSFNKKNYNHILVNPGYDNVINYYKAFNPANKMLPQIFHGGRMPFVCSARKLLVFLIARIGFKYKYSDNADNIIKSYKSNLYDFEFDFAKIFQSTIVDYLRDVRWMANYIDMFWGSCLEKGKGYLMIFSLSPVHLDSYFLIKKTKESSGKLAVWQHGGVYSYTDYFQHYITDYKNIDYFLSFGKCNINEVTKSMKDALPACVEVGTNVIYGKPLSNLRGKKTWGSQGLFISTIVGRFYGQSSIKWRGDLQFRAVKQIVDFFGSGIGSNVVIKGLKNYRPHQEIQRYIEAKEYKYVSYSDISIDEALSNNPKFIILDDSSTPLSKVLARYWGPIFLMVNQKARPIRKDVLALLKRRVVYSKSADELKAQLTDFFKNGSLGSVNLKDASFVDVYLKRFCYRDYERFLQEAMSTCQ